MQPRITTDPMPMISNGMQVKTLPGFQAAAAQCHIGTSNPRFMTVVMDISNKCNLRCRMCYFSFDRYFKVEPIYISPPQFQEMAAVLLPNARTLTLSCGNEPLTSPHFIEILKIAHDHRVPHIDFATNGMLLDEEKAEAVIRYGVTEIFLSVDAAQKETYESIRRGAHFDRLLKNIRYLQERKNVLKRRHPRLRFNITLMKTNISQLEELVILAHQLGIEKLDFRHLIVYDGLNIEEESLSNQKELANNYLHRAVARAKELKLSIVEFPGYFRINGRPPDAGPDVHKLRFKHLWDSFRGYPGYFLKNGYYRFKDMVSARVFSSQTQPVYCRLPFSYVLINAGGNVYPCPYCHGEEPYGNISPGSEFTEVWLGKKYQELRQRIMANDPPGMCRKCPTQIGSTENQKVFEAREV